MTDLHDTAMSSKAWPFVEAREILKRFEKTPPKDGVVLFETGYGPSGLPHLGTFSEVLRTTMIQHAFEKISDLPTRLIVFSDDLDGMRKVPENVPNQDLLQNYLQMPLTSVPDPFEKYDSFGAHNNAKLREFLDAFGFEYEFYSATEFYKSGQFDPVLKLAAERYDDIMKVMLKSLREERQQSYSCFLPIHPETGQVLYVPMKHVDGANGTITFDDEQGREWTIPVTGGNCKLQWKPDFGARWAQLGVDFEMYGKDHSTNTAIYDRICEILGGQKPNHFVYELFLDENGQKISKSKGNGLSLDEWLRYASTESLSYYLFQKPKTAKRLHWDVIPKMQDEYHQQLRAYPDQTLEQQLANPVYHIHNGDVPKSFMVVPYSMLLNLASVTGAEDKDTLWGFIVRYAPDASPETNPDMDRAAARAVAYYQDHIKPFKTYRAPTEQERKALFDLRTRLDNWAGQPEPEALQSMIFQIGKDHGFDPLRDWFKACYEVLLGASQGPRFGGFVAIYGVENTVALIDRALAGELAS